MVLYLVGHVIEVSHRGFQSAVVHVTENDMRSVRGDSLEPLCDLMDKFTGVFFISSWVYIHKSHEYLREFPQQIWGGAMKQTAVLNQQYIVFPGQ